MAAPTAFAGHFGHTVFVSVFVSKVLPVFVFVYEFISVNLAVAFGGSPNCICRPLWSQCNKLPLHCITYTANTLAVLFALFWTELHYFTLVIYTTKFTLLYVTLHYSAPHYKQASLHFTQ